MVYYYLNIFKAFKCFGTFILGICLVVSACHKEVDYSYEPEEITQQEYKTKNIFVIVVDGLRYSEGWGDSTHQYIPRMAKVLSSQGVINTRFYNMGGTYTSAGHTNLTTGIYQQINNVGLEYPQNPSFFQYWNQASHNESFKSWIIASKDKLAILGNCTNEHWSGKYLPSVNSGFDGLGIGSGYRDDSLTLNTAIEILKQKHPHLVLINFMEPDYSGHYGTWDDYIQGIRKTDEYVYQLWQFLQNDRIYKNTTTIFVTNDHGRHLDSIAGGFAGHGDDCDGCRHLNFLASGPDFMKDTILNVFYEQIDISVTIGELLGFKIPNSKGKVMTELFEKR